MSLSRDSKQERIAKFLMRHEFRGKQGVERILWEENVLIPMVNRLKKGESIPELKLEAGFVYDIEVVEPHENTSHQASPDSSGATDDSADASQANSTPDQDS